MPRSAGWRAAGLFAGALAGVLIGCADEPAPEERVAEHDLGALQLLMTDDEALFARPREIALDPSGHLHVLDRTDRRVVVLDPEGEVVRTIGRSGEGPGEFMDPLFLGVDDDVLRLFDNTRSIVATFSSDGTFRDEVRTGIMGPPTWLSFGDDGRIAYWGFIVPSQGGLVAVLDGPDGEVAFVGEAVSGEMLDQSTFLDQLHRRELPGFLRNTALPVFGADGELWVFLQAEGIVKRFGAEGSLEARHQLDEPEMSVIETAYFDWYAEVDSPQALRFLSYAATGIVVDGALWLLWEMPEGHPGLITVHDRDGAIVTRLTFAEPEAVVQGWMEGPARRRFAVDRDRGRVYFIDQQAVTVAWLSLPAEF